MALSEAPGRGAKCNKWKADWGDTGGILNTQAAARYQSQLSCLFTLTWGAGTNHQRRVAVVPYSQNSSSPLQMTRMVSRYACNPGPFRPPPPSPSPAR